MSNDLKVLIFFVFFTLPQRGCFIVEVALKPNVLSSYFATFLPIAKLLTGRT
jgi:hypothetical protein